MKIRLHPDKSETTSLPILAFQIDIRFPIQKGSTVMRKFLEKVSDFLKREDGPTAVEYAVMLALIIVVCIAAISLLGHNASATFANVALNTAAGS